VERDRGADELLKTNYKMPDAASILGATRSKRAEVVAAPVVMTAARDEEFDFSLPIVPAGMQMMVRDTGETAAPNPLRDLLDSLLSKTTVMRSSLDKYVTLKLHIAGRAR
jgi:polar amino acid transport system substrate-binding protein